MVLYHDRIFDKYHNNSGKSCPFHWQYRKWYLLSITQQMHYLMFIQLFNPCLSQKPKIIYDNIKSLPAWHPRCPNVPQRHPSWFHCMITEKWKISMWIIITKNADVNTNDWVFYHQNWVRNCTNIQFRINCGPSHTISLPDVLIRRDE